VTTISDWRPPIVEMVTVKQGLAAWDPKGIFPHHLPEVAATPENIDAAEAALGISLDAEHRAFLTYADGWQAFYQDVTLMGAAQLVRSPARDAALEAFTYAPEVLEEDLHRRPDRLLPIAASTTQADVFCMPVDDGRAGSRVFWLAEGELIDTFDSFGQYFVSMIDYTKEQIADMQDLARKAGLTDQ